MPTEPYKPIIFISYAHADEPEKPAADEIKWLSFVTGYLRPAVKHGAVDIWVDRLMPGGADWEREIGAKLRACDIFVLLVSHHSLSSDYIVDREIAIIRERQANGEDVHFYPLLLTPTPKIALDVVRDKNLRPRDGKPFFDYSLNDRYQRMSEAADEIAAIAGEIAAHKIAQKAHAEDQRRAIARIKDRVSLKEWLEGQNCEVAVTIAARSALRTAPLAVRALPNQSGAKKLDTIAALASEVFRAAALARVAAKYSARASDLRLSSLAATDAVRATPDYRAAVAAAAVQSAPDDQPVAIPTAAALSRAAAASASAAAAAWANANADANAAIAAVDAAVSAAAVGSDAAAWEEVRLDAATFARLGANRLADSPLWSGRAPDWARDDWARLQGALPRGEDWEVWKEWYEERLRGGSHGEAHEVAFASVPLDVWDKGPAAANRWIREHLP
jgi:hypothetical protein